MKAATERQHVAAGQPQRARPGPGELERRLHPLGARVAEEHLGVAGGVGERPRELDRGAVREQVRAVRQQLHLPRHRARDPRRGVTERVDADAAHEIDVLAPRRVHDPGVAPRDQLEPGQRVERSEPLELLEGQGAIGLGSGRRGVRRPCGHGESGPSCVLTHGSPLPLRGRSWFRPRRRASDARFRARTRPRCEPRPRRSRPITLE